MLRLYRTFHTTSLCPFPRAPKRPCLDLSVKAPSKEALLVKLPPKVISSQPVVHPVPKQVGHRNINNVSTAIPLPMNYNDARNASVQVSKEPPKYYQITLMRGVLGLPTSTKKIVKSLGLSKRHQVVWKSITPSAAGMILKIKELVRVELVSEIPPKVEIPLGYTKVGNAIGQWQ